MARNSLISAVSFLLVLATGPVAVAEWSDDPGQNLAVADRLFDQVQPKLIPTADGGCYISWFDNRSGGYDVYLQRLDANGDEQWAHDGVLVADRSYSSTQDYGLDVDSAGNALLVFRDDRGTSEQITASKIAPDGTLLWGAAGVPLSSGTAFFAAPKIAGTSDGGSVVGWIRNSDTRLQKLDASGLPQWGAGITLSDSNSGSFFLSDIQASDGVNVIVSWVRQGENFSDPKHIWAQKFNGSGFMLWGASHVKVFDGGSLQFGNFPSFITDGSGGAVFSWYSTSPLQCSTQRILASGTEAFPHNGVTGSTDATRTRVSPDVAFNPTTEEIFLFWTEMNSNQSQWGVYGQKIAADGSRQWTSTGKILRPLGGTQLTQVSTEAYSDASMVFYVESLAFGNDRLFATGLDTNGDAVWSPPSVSASSVVSGKGSLDTQLSSHGVALLAWSDDRSGDRDIYAQNVNDDGTLGRSCYLLLNGTAPTLIDCPAPFYLLAGVISSVRDAGDFTDATCAGYFRANPGLDPLEDPAVGETRYYLARGEEDRCLSYGDSSLVPDPREELDMDDPCP